MPMYTYVCAACRRKVDVLQKWDEQSPPTTEDFPTKCDGTQSGDHVWSKMIHPPNVAFGRGWGGGKGNW